LVLCAVAALVTRKKSANTLVLCAMFIGFKKVFIAVDLSCDLREVLRVSLGQPQRQ
jgi:hypothetical protein